MLLIKSINLYYWLPLLLCLLAANVSGQDRANVSQPSSNKVSELSARAPDTGLQGRNVVQGKVTDDKGKPLGGAVVRLEQDGWELVHTKTSESGEFQLSAAGREAPCLVSANLANFVPVRTNLLLRPGQPQHLTLVLVEYTSVFGKVLALDKTPLTNIVIQVVQLNPPLSSTPPAASLPTNQNAGAVESAPGSLQPGLMAEYFQLAEAPDDFPPAIDLQQPSIRRIDPQIKFALSTGPFGQTELRINFYSRWTGKLRIAKPGKYTFFLNSDDGSRLFIDGRQIVDNGGLHGPLEKSGEIELNSGDHDLKIEFFQRDGYAACQLSWSAEGMPQQIVPVEVLFHHHAPQPPTAYESTILSGIAYRSSQLTDEEGKYHFRGLPAGRYRVRCHLLGRVEEQETETGAGAQPKDIEVAPFKVAPPNKGLWKSFTALDGLIDATCMSAETNGVMWFGSLGGAVTRYDGRQFTKFQRDASVINNDFVWSLKVDAAGGVWAGNRYGLSRFYGTNWALYTPPGWEAWVSINSSERVIAGIEVDNQGFVWIGRNQTGGADRFDGQKFQHFTTEQGLPNNSVSMIRRGPDGQLWFATAGGVARYDGQQFTVLTKKDGLVSNSVNDILFARNGDIWFGTDNGLSRYDGKTFTNFTTRDGLPNGVIYRMAEDEEGVLWLGHGVGAGGLTRFDGKSFLNYSQGGMGNDQVMAVHCFRGAVWVATLGGVARYDDRSLITFSKRDGRSSDGDSYIKCAPDGTVWCASYGLVGTQCKIDRFDGQRFTTYATQDGLPAGPFRSMEIDPDGTLWVGTSDGVARWDGKRFVALPAPKGELTGVITLIHRAADGTHWFGIGNSTLSTLVHYDDQKFTSYGQADGIKGFFNSASSAPDGTEWFTSPGGGTFRYDGKGFSSMTDTNALSDMFGLVVLCEPDGTVWLGSQFSGMTKFDGRTRTSLPKADRELAPRFCLSIYRDRRGVLWFGSAAGLYRYDRRTWTSLNSRDGLPSDSIGSIAGTSDGAIWLGTAAGLVRYRSATNQPNAPVITVQADKEYTDLVQLPPITQGTRITLKYPVVDTNHRPENQQFHRRLAPGRLTADEVLKNKSAETQTRAMEYEFTPKEPGIYTFAVQYVDVDLNYSAPVAVVLSVVPVWYRNARIAVPGGIALGGLLLTSFVSTSRYRAKRREAQRLRERLLEKEQLARQAAEASSQALAAKNAQLDAARKIADDANKTKSQFLANMSHELRTPLNAIIGYSEMLQEEAQDLGQEDFVPDLQKIHGAGKHLLGLINDILDLSKIEAGKMTLFLENFDVATLIREVESTMRPMVARKANRLQVEFPENIGNMRADQTKLRQVLYNLLSNASKFTEKGTITLEVRMECGGSTPLSGAHDPPPSDRDTPPPTEGKSGVKPPHSIIFSVTDTGIGMTPEQLGKMFQAFTQADASTTKKFGGTGLGLSISKKFCQMMGGDLTVTSEYGKGSTFTAELPVEVQEPKAPEISVVASAALSPLDPRVTTVLVIDDDPTVQDLMQRQLSKEGYRVAVASNGEQGLRLARELKPAVITLDVMLPGQDGWSVLNALKADRELAEIPVIMMTVVDEKQMGFALGAADYLTKPIDWDRLSAVLTKYRKGDDQALLVVEDDPAARDMLERSLAKAGWKVALAENGKVGLDRVKTRMPSLILLDLMMPEMDGFEFMRELRGKKEWQSIPVIVITAKELTAEDRRRLDGQVERIIQKGAYRLDELVEEVRRTLARTNQEAQLCLPLVEGKSGGA